MVRTLDSVREIIGDTRYTPDAAEEGEGRDAWAGRELSFIAAFAKEQDSILRTQLRMA
jgi:hypothetical protein